MKICFKKAINKDVKKSNSNRISKTLMSSLRETTGLWMPNCTYFPFMKTSTNLNITDYTYYSQIYSRLRILSYGCILGKSSHIKNFMLPISPSTENVPLFVPVFKPSMVRIPMKLLFLSYTAITSIAGTLLSEKLVYS